jgi:hypothetical protein
MSSYLSESYLSNTVLSDSTVNNTQQSQQSQQSWFISDSHISDSCNSVGCNESYNKIKSNFNNNVIFDKKNMSNFSRFIIPEKDQKINAAFVSSNTHKLDNFTGKSNKFYKRKTETCSFSDIVPNNNLNAFVNINNPTQVNDRIIISKELKKIVPVPQIVERKLRMDELRASQLNVDDIRPKYKPKLSLSTRPNNPTLPTNITPIPIPNIDNPKRKRTTSVNFDSYYNKIGNEKQVIDGDYIKNNKND